MPFLNLQDKPNRMPARHAVTQSAQSASLENEFALKANATYTGRQQCLGYRQLSNSAL